MTTTRVNKLHPLSAGFTLKLRVVSVISRNERARPDGSKLVIGQYLCGDETGLVIVTARDRQCAEFTPDALVELRNARCELFQGRLRVEADAFGSVLRGEGASIEVDYGFNASEEVFELVREEVAGSGGRGGGSGRHGSGRKDE